MSDWARRELLALEAAGLRRRLPDLAGSGPEIRLDGRPVLNFASHNYLGLADHPAAVEAAAATLAARGLGAGGARLTAGAQPEHRRLEAAAAAFLDEPAALLFNSGYAANQGVLAVVAGRGDAVYSDERNHASIVDGARLSRAAVHVFPHGDAAALDRLLAEGAGYRRRVVVVESLYSVDGDEPPLAEIARVARARGALLVVDEAHAAFVCGPGGRGLCATAGVRPDLRVLTLSKALGAFGAVVAGDRDVVDLLANRARSFVFTTALPPALAAAAEAALAVAAGPEGDRRRARLAAHAARLREAATEAGWPAPPGRRHVIAVRVGEAAAAVAAAARLIAGGAYAATLRPPTVPPGESCLRFAPMATHTDAQVERAAALLATLRGDFRQTETG